MKTIYIKMNTIYFEKMLEDEKISNKTLIALSEARRRDFSKIVNVEHYKELFNAVARDVKYKRIPIMTHPVFEWNNVTSTNWNFERLQVENLLVELYTNKMRNTADPKEAVKLCDIALKHRLDTAWSLETFGWAPSELRSTSIMNVRYHLSELFKTAAMKYYSMFTFKENKTAIKYAYQLDEIGSRLWGGELKDFKYMSLALRSMAMDIPDDQIGERIALLNKVKGKPGVPGTIDADLIAWAEQNNRVYFTPVSTEKKLPVLSLEEAFNIVTKKN